MIQEIIQEVSIIDNFVIIGHKINRMTNFYIYRNKKKNHKRFF